MKVGIKLFFAFFLILPFAAHSQTASSAGKQLNIFTLGDSNGTFPDSWPQQLKSALSNAQVFNISRSGRTIGFINNGDSSLNSLLVIDDNLKKAADFTKDRPFDYIVLQLGTNDAKAIFADRQKEVPQNLERLILKIKGCNYSTINQARIIIISPPPYGVKADSTEKYKGGDSRVRDMSKAFKTVASRNNCLFVNGYTTPGLDINTMTADGLHLDAAGSRKLIEPVLTLITGKVSSFDKKNGGIMIHEIQVDAPFTMPKIKAPDFSRCKKLNIADHGAVQGDKEKTSLAIAKAIDEANQLGGGGVIIPEGEWLTKKIHLKSNVALHLLKGAVLLFSENPDDYLPAVHSTWEGMECYNYSPLIYAYECKNIAITGEGEIKAKLDVWKNWYARPMAIWRVSNAFII